MEQADKLKILFVINPVSGGTDKRDLQSAIDTYFRPLPHDVNHLLLTGQGDEQHIRQAILRYAPDRVVAVGGDGTVKLVAEQLLRTNRPLGILPAGSANGMARELGLPDRPDHALDVIVRGLPVAIDVIQLNGRDLCLHLSDIGMNAQLVHYYHENNWRGKLGYLRGVARVLLRRRLMKIELEAADRIVNRSAFMVVIANARMYGTGAVINPDGDLTDGFFEVVIIRQFSWWEILKMFWRFRPFDSRKTEIIRASAVRISTRKRVYFQVDGEYRGRVNHVEARLLRGKLTVLTPPNSPSPP